MHKKELLEKFDRVFHPESTYVRMYEQHGLAERIILLLLAAKVRMFPSKSDVQLKLLVGFMRVFMNRIGNIKLLEFWLSIVPFLEFGSTKKNAIFIEHRTEWLFSSLEPDEYNEDVLIVTYVACCILFRKPSFTKKLCEIFCANGYEIMAQHFDVKEGSDFLQLCMGNIFTRLRGDPMAASRSSYTVLPTAASAIYHFTERYLRYIWDPSDMSEDQDYVDAVGDLIDAISDKPLLVVSSLTSCR